MVGLVVHAGRNPNVGLSPCRGARNRGSSAGVVASMGNAVLVDEDRLDTDASPSLAPEPDVASPGDRSAPRRGFVVHRLLPKAYRLLRAIASAPEWLFGFVSLALS